MTIRSPGLAEMMRAEQGLSDARERLEAERVELVAMIEAFDAFYLGALGRAPEGQRARVSAFRARAEVLAADIAAIDRQLIGCSRSDRDGCNGEAA